MLAVPNFELPETFLVPKVLTMFGAGDYTLWTLHIGPLEALPAEVTLWASSAVNQWRC